VYDLSATFGPSKPSPPADVIVDASWSGGIGGIAYVSRTIGVRALVRRYRNATEAEMGAVLLAMHDARGEDHHKIVIGTDNQAAALVETVTARAGPSLMAAAAEIRRFMEEMPDWQLVHIPRRLTRRAHVLAIKTMRDRLRKCQMPDVRLLSRFPYEEEDLEKNCSSTIPKSSP
jgi:ribonuclease HI